VHLEGVGAVFEVVGGLVGVGGQLALLADRDEAGAEREGDGGAEDESARLGADDEGDVLAAVGCGERLDDVAEEPRVGEHRGDVAEDDARLREVHDRADGVFHGVHRVLLLIEVPGGWEAGQAGLGT